MNAKLDILVKLEGSWTVLKLEQPENVLPSIVFILSGITIVVKALQLAKAELLMLDTPTGISIAFRLTHPLNALVPIRVSALGKVTDVRP